MSSFRWQLFSLQYWQIFPGRAQLRSILSASQDASYVSFHPRFLILFFIRLWQFRCETSWWKLGWIILDCRASSWVFLSSRLKNFSIIYLNKICIQPNSHHSRMSIYIGHWFSWWQDWGSWYSVEDVLDFLFHQQADVSPHAGMLSPERGDMGHYLLFGFFIISFHFAIFKTDTMTFPLLFFSSHEDILEHQ